MNSFQIKKIFLMILLFITIYSVQIIRASVFRLIKELLQNNVAGEPIVHESSVWEFDPDISEKRRPIFYDQHGYRAGKFIQKIGLGIDGKEQQRFIEQSVRDRGRLNGEHVKNFP